MFAEQDALQTTMQPPGLSHTHTHSCGPGGGGGGGGDLTSGAQQALSTSPPPPSLPTTGYPHLFTKSSLTQQACLTPEREHEDLPNQFH